MNDKELCTLGIEKLKMRFRKIEPDQYYLAYSGGRDSHLLYWFIKNILKDKDIKIVAVNTFREHQEIKNRMYAHSDQVLLPTMKMEEIKDKYGIPCFTKSQDEVIRRYQGGCRTDYLMGRINGTDTVKFGLNQTAKELLLNETLHKVSGECCKYTKKLPFKLYEKETGLKPIIAVRGSESLMRKQSYQSCLSEKGVFTPMYDFTDAMCRALEVKYDIEIPTVYNYLDRTGCAGCPYGYHGKKTTALELALLTPSQRKYAMESFKESYEVLGVDMDIQLDIFNYKELKE